MRHKHADLIHAWVEGAAIQFKDSNGEWIDIFAPPVCYNTEYRIKPEKKPDVVTYHTACIQSVKSAAGNYPTNLKLTFDGETGKLLKAEVL